MAKSRNQKGKILVLEHLLMETGENHIVTMQEILDKLLECGITAERKSIYDDLEALREFGLDVQYKRGRPGGYYLAGRGDLPEMPVQTVKENNVKSAEKTKESKTSKEADTVIVSVGNILCKEEIQENSDKVMKLQCSGEKEKEIREYFGNYGEYKLKDSGILHVTVPQIAGPKFYGWLAMMGKNVHILKPKKAAAAYRDYLKTLAKEYKGI